MTWILHDVVIISAFWSRAETSSLTFLGLSNPWLLSPALGAGLEPGLAHRSSVPPQTDHFCPGSAPLIIVSCSQWNCHSAVGPTPLWGGQVSGDLDSEAQACPGQNPLVCFVLCALTEQGQNQEQKLVAVVFYRLLRNEHEWEISFQALGTKRDEEGKALMAYWGGIDR